MKNVYIYCEGQTEEAFINEIVMPYFVEQDIYVYPFRCTTSNHRGVKYKGGAVSYDKIKNELTKICKEHKNERVTTFFDYYGMPKDTPGIDIQEVDIYKRVVLIEKEIEKDLNLPNLFFHLVLHEFEGLLFSRPDAFSVIVNDETVQQIQAIRDNALTPEHINNSPETAPSKRLISIIPSYAKIRYGIIISKETGIHKMMEECYHFAMWITKIKNC